MQEELLDTKEACEYLDVSYWTLTHCLLEKIPHIRHSKRGKIKFRKSTLDKYLEEKEEKSMQKNELNLTPNKREMSIEQLREKYKKTNNYAKLENTMKEVIKRKVGAQTR